METRSEQAEQTGALFERPSYRERANKRFLYVLVPCLAVNLVGLLTSGVSGWAALWATAVMAYGTTMSAAVITLLVALVPGKRRRVS